ncbi:hypothetical protein L3X38_001390 [Prunus dulcis]|uniref:Uncharacterized protein n=1 Tax=Prunus dulcis TaxID=3755 RepID=A0AAD4ZKA8_PRUDU|nr:hypothetical protein L3X38_001390 [Prunus dulcis]
MSYTRRLLETAKRENEERMHKCAEEEREWEAADDQVVLAMVMLDQSSQQNRGSKLGRGSNLDKRRHSWDQVDEIARMGKSTILEYLVRFCGAIETIYTRDYLHKPIPRGLQKLLQKIEKRGFPSMIGSIDCMHWPWFPDLSFPCLVCVHTPFLLQTRHLLPC